MIQSRTAQRRILEAATRDGTLATLLWYIVADIGGGQSQAVAVNGWIPTVRVAPDPATTEHDAHLLLELCRHYSPGLILRVELTATDVLEDARMMWFVYGEHDIVCPLCGAVGWESCVCQPTLWAIEGSMAAERIAELEVANRQLSDGLSATASLYHAAQQRIVELETRQSPSGAEA